MGDPWGTEGFKERGEGLEGANRKKKLEEKYKKSKKNCFFREHFVFNICYSSVL